MICLIVGALLTERQESKGFRRMIINILVQFESDHDRGSGWTRALR